MGLVRYCHFDAARVALRILTIAGAISTFIIQRFEGPDETTTLSTSDVG